MASNWYSDFYRKQNRERFFDEEKENLKESEIKLMVKRFNEFKEEEKPEEERKEDYKEPKIILDAEKKIRKIDRKMIFFISLIIVIVILLFLYFFSGTDAEKENKLINISILKTGDLPMDVYYNSIKIMSLSGWETKIKYSNKSDRLFGNENYKSIIFDDNGTAYIVSSFDNEIRLEPLKTNPENITKIGWFTNPNDISVTEDNAENKTIDVKFINGKREIKNIDLKYFLYNNQDFFNVRMNTDSENQSELKDIAYGLLIKNSDVYLSNGTILKNDNKIIVLNNSIDVKLIKNGKPVKNISKGIMNSLSKKYDLNRKSIIRNGSYYKEEGEYEIFYNKELKKAIIVYSPDISYFENSFYWDAFWIHINPSLLESSVLYFFIFDNPKLRYDNELGDWDIQTNEFSGEAMLYIYEKVYEIENNN